MKRLAVILGLSVLMAGLSAFDAAPAYAEKPCGTERWAVDEGKSQAAFHVTATDGCHTYEWTGTGRACGFQPFTLTTSKANQVWEPGSTLPQPNGEGGYQVYQAAHEANLMWNHGFEAPAGTDVKIRCT